MYEGGEMSVRTETTYIGVCDECEEYSPEVRGSFEEAYQDSVECPCKIGVVG